MRHGKALKGSKHSRGFSAPPGGKNPARRSSALGDAGYLGSFHTIPEAVKGYTTVSARWRCRLFSGAGSNESHLYFYLPKCNAVESFYNFHIFYFPLKDSPHH